MSTMFTLTINQTDSRRDGDRVPHLLKDLRHIPARLDFDRSVEDEVQGIVDSPHQAVEAALIALRCGSWYVGIGVGPVNEPLPNQIKDASGHGLVYARRAVDRLRNSKERIPVAVEGPPAYAASRRRWPPSSALLPRLSARPWPGRSGTRSIQPGRRRPGCSR